MFFNSSLTKKNLSDNQVHLWTLTPDKITDQTQLTALDALLSEDERLKVKRYRLPKAQKHALITRAFVRSVLALYVKQQPQALTFTISEQGKPELSHPTSPIRFNLSHNDQLIICAVCLNADIGCDIENLHRKISLTSIAKRYFTTTEYQSLLKLSKATQQTRFFEYWTLKESFVKATGRGISQGLDTFSFEIGEAMPGETIAVNMNTNIKLSFSGNDNKEKTHGWQHCLLYPDQSHCAAISVYCKKSTRQTSPATYVCFNANDYLA